MDDDSQTGCAAPRRAGDTRVRGGRLAGLNRRSLIKAGAGAAGGLGLFGPSA
jgi:hypothetical protein